MFVKRDGAGAEPFFGLHGWGGDHRTFAPLGPDVPAHASLYSMDLPGCGNSPPPSEWTVGEIVEEIVRTVRASSDRRATIVGNCGGAIFALLAAARAEETIERVVMIDPFAYLPRYFRLFTSEGIGRHAYNATFANPLGRWITNQSLRARRDGSSDLTVSFAGIDHEVARRYLTLFAEAGNVEQFRGFAAPVDIAHGEKTFGAVKRSLGLWRAVLPRVRVYELKGAGHLPLEEATEQVASILFGDEGED